MQAQIVTQILKTKCERCGHERILRKEDSKICPECGHVQGARIYKIKKKGCDGLSLQAQPPQPKPTRIPDCHESSGGS
jgi:Zn finger protein HypA/HybF involved in hydrogenase expression